MLYKAILQFFICVKRKKYFPGPLTISVGILQITKNNLKTLRMESNNNLPM